MAQALNLVWSSHIFVKTGRAFVTSTAVVLWLNTVDGGILTFLQEGNYFWCALGS